MCERGGRHLVVVEMTLLLDCGSDLSLNSNRVLLKSRAVRARIVAEKVELKTTFALVRDEGGEQNRKVGNNGEK